MKEYIETTKPEEMDVLKGVKIAASVKDGSFLVSITLEDDEGNRITFKKDSSYGNTIHAVIPKPPEQVDIFKLSGAMFHNTVPFVFEFTSEKEASDKKEKLYDIDPDAHIELVQTKGAVYMEAKPEVENDDNLPF